MSLEDRSGQGEFDKAARFRARSRAAIAAGFVLLFLAALCAMVVAVSEERTAQTGRQSRRVREVQSDLFTAVRDAETAQRGYLLTGDAVYLAPFAAARERLPRLERKLHSSAVDAADQTRGVAVIAALIERELKALNRAVELRRVGETEKALAVVRSGEALDLMQRIRLESAAFERADDVMADQRRLLQAQQRQVLIWTMVAALIIAIGLAVFVAREIGLYAAALADRYEALSLESDRRAHAEMQLRQAQKMEALGQLTGGVAHDFNNMLAVVIGNLDMLLRRLQGQDERLHALAENALKGANTAAALTKSLLAFSRLQPLTPRSTDVNACVAEMAEVLRRTLGEHIAVETALEDGLWPAFVDAPQLESALLNLAVNARDAMAAGGRLAIETANARLETDDGEAAEAGEYVMVAVSDSGAGMTPEVMEKAFDPFFTTKEVGAGTGLGLSQVHGFVKQSGGRIRLESELGRGTSVRLYLPRDRAGAPAPDPAGHRPAAADAGHALVLVVEDDPGVRAFVTSAVRELGYGVVEADTAAAALERLGEDPSIALLLTDVVMPQMTGRALADQARGRRPDLAVVFMTGYTRGAVVHDRAIEAGVRLLAKPFTVSDLARELNAAMAETRPLPSTAPT